MFPFPAQPVFMFFKKHGALLLLNANLLDVRVACIYFPQPRIKNKPCNTVRFDILPSSGNQIIKLPRTSPIRVARLSTYNLTRSNPTHTLDGLQNNLLYTISTPNHRLTDFHWTNNYCSQTEWLAYFRLKKCYTSSCK